VADLYLGTGIREAAKKHGVGRDAVSRWKDEIGQNRTLTEIVPEDADFVVRARVERFNKALEDFLHAGIELGQAHATLLKEREFLNELDPAKVEPMLESVDRKWLALLARIGS
jgi:transposase-like protein